MSAASLSLASVAEQPFTDALLDACDQLPICLAIKDPSGKTAFANKAFVKAFGTSVLTSPEMMSVIGTLPLAGGYQLLTMRETARTEQDIDALTGLPNRKVLGERLWQSLAANSDGGAALLLLDLDRFKIVNDTLGHPIGDKLLCRVVDRLRKVTTRGDTLVRLGGDEFAILQTQAKQPQAAHDLAQRIVDLLGRSYIIEEHLLNVGVSIGIALLPTDGADPDRLLTSADLALYTAKEAGRGRFCFFEQAMDHRAQARRTLEIDLRRALTLREFEVYYQPQLSLGGGAIGGFEALIRWNHPVQGMVSPIEFIPIAEETGLIVQIGEWVLRTACKEAMNWPDHIKIAVNLSAVQFSRPGLVSTVTSALAWSRLPPERLELEITESVLLDDATEALKTLHQLRDLGIHIAMDDFGTGYSSLSYLRAFPFDKVKIDQSFIREMHQDSGCAAIVRAVVGLGNSLGITTTAEGVESEQQLEHLRAEGCTDVQGYLISRPVPADKIGALLKPSPL